MPEHIIPKTIHYCWFGRGEKPEIVNKCIRSWEDKLQDYDIVEWNEENFDVNQIQYTKQAYAAKKYAFVADYARIWVLKKYGGIYLDTDVEVLKPLDCFLDNKMFCGFESPTGVSPGLILGAQKNHPLLDELLLFYHNNDYIDENGTINSYTAGQNMTNTLIKHGLILDCDRLQNIDGATIYPRITFCPSKYDRDKNIYSTQTYTVHHYMASWMSSGKLKKLQSPFWRFIYSILSKSGKIAKSLLGERRWIKIRNKYLKKLYDFSRGI